MSSTSGVHADTSVSNSEPAAESSRQQLSNPAVLSPPPPPKDEPQPPQKQLNGSDGGADGQEDSEAETEILLPDQKDEATNGPPIKNENTEDSPMIDAPAVGDEGSKFRLDVSKSSNGMQSEGATRRASEAGEIDRDKSRLSSQRTSPTVSGQSAGRRKSSSVDASTPDVKNGGAEHTSPVPLSSRKRKVRDETSPGEKREVEPPRQRHKTDLLDTSIQRSSRERSPSPKKYPHRRTTSTQFGLPNGQVQKKRKPPALSSARIASYQEEWESDSSSDSMPHPQTQPKRFSHRSVSTPGRAMVPRKRLKDRYGMTPFAIACQEGDLDRAKETLAEDPSMLDEPDNDQNTPLQSAALAGQERIVEFLIQQRCNIHTMNRLQETPLIDAVENAEVNVVRLLLDAGVDPSRPNKKGRQPVDLVPKPDPSDDDEVAAAKEIRNILKAAIQRNHGSNRTPRLEQPEDNEDENKKRKDLDILDRTTKNLRNLVENNDKYGVRTFLEAMVRVDNNCLVAAAKGGHTDLMNVLLPLVDPDKVDFTKPLLAAIGRGHLDIVELLLKQDLDPTLKSSDDKFYWEIAEERQGPNWQTERNFLKTAYDDSVARKDKKRFKTSPESKSRLAITSKREKADKLLPSSTGFHEKRRASISSNVRRPSSPELTKPKRTLIRGKDRELSNNGSARRRRVVDDEDESDDEDVKSSPGGHRVGRPKGSSSPRLKRKERHTSEPTSLKTQDEKSAVKPTAADIERSGVGKVADMKSHRKRNAEDDGDSLAHRERKRAAENEQMVWRERELKEEEAKEKEAKDKEAKEAAEREAEEREKARLDMEAAERAAAEKEKSRLVKEAAEREAAERETERLAREAAEREAAEQERQRLAREAEESRRKQAEAEAAAAAEKARQEAEERARREAEQRELEQREREREREERLSRLPPAISAACRAGAAFPLRRTKYINAGGIVEPGVLTRFTPVIGIQGHEIGISSTDESEAAAKELWVLSFQACALLGLHEIDTSRNQETKQWRVQPSSRIQRDGLWAIVNSGGKLSYPPRQDPSTVEEQNERRAEAGRIKQTWLDCDDIAWVRWSDVNAAVRQSPRLNVKGVSFSVEIRAHFDYVDVAAPSTTTDGPTPQVNGGGGSASSSVPNGPHRPWRRKAALQLMKQGITGTVPVLRELQEHDRSVPGVGVWRGGELPTASYERTDASITNTTSFHINGETSVMAVGGELGSQPGSRPGSGMSNTAPQQGAEPMDIS